MLTFHRAHASHSARCEPAAVAVTCGGSAVMTKSIQALLPATTPPRAADDEDLLQLLYLPALAYTQLPIEFRPRPPAMVPHSSRRIDNQLLSEQQLMARPSREGTRSLWLTISDSAALSVW